MALEHEQLRLEDCLVGQREVDSHLVAVEVGIERRTCQRVQLDGLTLDELRLERLDTQTVKRRSTVEEHGMALHDVLEDVPDDGLAAVDNLLGRLHGLDDAALDELADDERLVELGSHELRQTALVHVELRTDDDNRTGGVVDTLTEQVLTEAALLTLQRVGQRLQRTVGVALHGAGLAAVVEEGVDSLLEHTFLVAQNNLGGLDLHESLQAVVTDDDAAVEVVQVGCGETATIEGNERTELRRCDGDNLHDHPLGTVDVAAAAECLDDLEALQGLGLALLRRVGAGTVAELVGECVEVEGGEEVVDGLGTHLGDELVGIGILKILVVLRQVLDDLDVLLLGEQVHLVGTVQLVAFLVFLSFHDTRLHDDVLLVVDDCVELLRGKTEQIAHLVGQAAEVPYMGYGDYQVDVSGALAANLLLGNLDTATVADDALVADALVLTAGALVVLRRTEDALAEQTVALWLIGAVVDGFGLGHLAKRTLEDLLGRCESDGNLRKIILYL